MNVCMGNNTALVICNLAKVPIVIDDEERIAMLSLSLIKGIGPVNARKILAEFGEATAFFKAWAKGKNTLLRNGPLHNANIVSARREAEKEFRQTEKHQIRVLSLNEGEYPRRLRACDDSPLVLFTRGQMDLNAPRIVALVGTRKATPYGCEMAEALVHELHQLNACLVSGLALGIDSAAHRAADARHIQNVGVLAHGLDAVYPPGNRMLAKSMEQFGGLVSEFCTQTRPDRSNFPMRNRVIAGLSDAVVVVEAATTGGALITAGYANGYHRDVFAVPGRIGENTATGCNQLIRNNKAALLSRASDLGWYMGWEKAAETKSETKKTPRLSPDEETMAQLLRKGISELDEIAHQAGWAVSKTSATLLSMEFQGFLRSLPGKKYELTGQV